MKKLIDKLTLIPSNHKK